MVDNKIWGHSIKHYAVAVAVTLWLFVIAYALIKNPSTSDASGRMHMMKADMATMLGNGGAVIYRNENAKFGGALLSVLIRTDSWSRQLRGQDIKTLVDLGWQQTPTTPTSFCKQGVMAGIQEDVGDYKNTPTVLISMRYNATTVKTCK